MHKSDHLDRRKELILLDESNPRSIVSLLPDSLKILLKALWSSDHAELLGMTERRLRNHLAAYKNSPDILDERIRLNFWLEYERIQALPDLARGEGFNMAYVLGHQIPKEVFYKHYVTNPYKFIWILCPPADFESAAKLALAHCMDQLIFTMEKIQEEKEPTKNSMDFLLKLQERLSAQLHGTKIKGEKVSKEPRSEEASANEVPEQTLSAAEQLKIEMEAIERLNAASENLKPKAPVVNDED